MDRIHYVVITPARNEEAHIQKTIDSMISQTILPDAWVIVNDGSIDNTGPIIETAAKKHPWIKPIHRQDRGFRKPGGGVIEAFYDGFKHIPNEKWDFLVKLDGDLAFGTDYFERCFLHFKKNPKLGIGGGAVWSRKNGKWINDGRNDPPFHVRGATKIYCRNCWTHIHPLVAAPGWDTIDEVKANMHGWITYTFQDLKLHQQKPTGAADGLWQNWFKNGRANYITGYHPIFMTGKCLRRAFQKPILIGAVALFAGFFGGYFSKAKQLEDKEVIQYLQQQQINRLLGRPSLYRPHKAA